MESPPKTRQQYLLMRQTTHHELNIPEKKYYEDMRIGMETIHRKHVGRD